MFEKIDSYQLKPINGSKTGRSCKSVEEVDISPDDLFRFQQ